MPILVFLTVSTYACAVELEKQLLNMMSIIETMGKNGKPVPILIIKDVKEAVELLNTTRSQAFPDNKKAHICFAPEGMVL